MPVEIQCPVGGLQVLVAGQGSGGSGSAGTICVRGVYQEFEKRRAAGLIVLRIQVTTGPLGSGTTPQPQPNDVLAEVTGQHWCFRVTVPVCAPGGSPLVLSVWEEPSGGSGSGSGMSAPQVEEFVGVPSPGSGVIDCCAACGSIGSGSMAMAVEVRLPAGADLHVTVPDGPNAGLYTARPRGDLTWSVTVGGAEYHLLPCPTDGLVVHGGPAPVAATAVEYDPLSATVPGAPFGATAEALITQA